MGGLIIGFSMSVRRAGWLREAAQALGARSLVTAHLVRFVGIYFLWLHAQGRLPAEFAMRAGWGDVAAATGAVLLLIFWRETVGFRWLLIAWNLVGAGDLLLAVGTGGWLNATRPGSMIELAGLPLALVPLWLVPVLFSSHLWLIERCLKSLRGARNQPAANSGGAGVFTSPL